MIESLLQRTVANCSACAGSGYVDDRVCNCMILFRAQHRMVLGGFNDKTLEFVTSQGYQFPVFDSGSDVFHYYLQNSLDVMAKGLSLYIYSKDRGRGKTTLAHYLVHWMATLFQRTEYYKRSRNYGFENVEDLLKGDKETWKSTVYVLDDLGNENRSAKWKKETASSVLQRVLHHRRDKRLPTIITSNYPPSRIGELYGGQLDSLLEIRPDGMIRGNLYRQIELGGAEDLRTIDESSEWPI